MNDFAVWVCFYAPAVQELVFFDFRLFAGVKDVIGVKIKFSAGRNFRVKLPYRAGGHISWIRVHLAADFQLLFINAIKFFFRKKNLAPDEDFVWITTEKFKRNGLDRSNICRDIFADIAVASCCGLGKLAVAVQKS